MSAVWAERARAHFSEKRQARTAKTDETPVLSVSSVPSQAISEKHASPATPFDRGVSSVSSVGVVALLENRALAEELLETHFPPGWVSFDTATRLENTSPATVEKFRQASAGLDALARKEAGNAAD